MSSKKGQESFREDACLGTARFCDMLRCCSSGLADTCSPLELHGPVPAHSAPLPVGGVVRLAQLLRVWPPCWCVYRLWRPLPQCLVRSVLVVLLLKPLETFLLLFPIRRRRTGCLRLQCAVEPLVMSVLLWSARHDSLHSHSQLDPPHAQPAQPLRSR